MQLTYTLHRPQHKVESVKNASETAVAQRKIVGHVWVLYACLRIADASLCGDVQLCFFLVDDETKQDDDTTPPSQEYGSTQNDPDAIVYHSFSYHGLKNRSVLTTSDVPWQRREPSLYSVLPHVCHKLTGKSLPAELVAHIIDLGDLGLSREMAEIHRRLLMKDRKVTPTTPDSGEGLYTYSLCEH